MGDSSVQIAQTNSKESTQSNRKVSSVQLLRSQTKVSSVRLETSKTQVCCNVCDETEQKPTSSKSLAHRLSHSDALALERQHRSNCSCTSSRPAVSVHSKLLIGKMASDRRNRNAKKRQPARRSCRVVKKRRPMKRSSRYRKCDLPRPLVLQHHSRSFQSLVSSATTVSSYDGCRFCGHRCCRKLLRSRSRRRRGKTVKVSKAPGKKKLARVFKSEAVQVGSRARLLSPLCVTSNEAAPTDCPPEPDSLEQAYSEVTPSMIHSAMRVLSTWKQACTIDAILNYLVRHYPVNPNMQALLEELEMKLRVAALAGTVTRFTPDTWSLPFALHDRRLTHTQVTRFWHLYADTMRPVEKKRDINSPGKGKQHDVNQENLPDYIA